MIFRAIAIGMLGIFLSCSTQSREDGTPWKEFVSKDAGISASFPCEPTNEVTKYSEKQSGYNFQCQDGDLRFRIMFGDHNPEPNKPVAKFLEYAIGDFEIATGRNGTIQKKGKTQVDGYDAWQYEVRSGRGMFLGLVAANEKGALTTMVGPFSADSSDSKDKNLASRFIDSIHFVK